MSMEYKDIPLSVSVYINGIKSGKLVVRDDKKIPVKPSELMCLENLKTRLEEDSRSTGQYTAAVMSLLQYREALLRDCAPRETILEVEEIVVQFLSCTQV